MSTLTLPSFNPLQFASRLKSVGVPEAQAEAEAEGLREAFDARDKAFSELEHRFSTREMLSGKEAEQMATKGDVFTVKADVLKLDAKIDLVRKDMDLMHKDMQALENRLIIKLSAVMAALIAFAGAVQVVVSKL